MGHRKMDGFEVFGCILMNMKNKQGGFIGIVIESVAASFIAG